uniref:Uncharacterized protein n=1 Tax=Cacopsylla melanoneura TaxID=428564 RepID=A0A8D9E119_9HEMI
MVTSFEAFSTPNLFLNLEWTIPKVEKSLSNPADEAIPVCSWFIKTIISGETCVWRDFHQAKGEISLYSLNGKVLDRNLIMSGIHSGWYFSTYSKAYVSS